MSVKVAFVAQIGRISAGNMTALPKVEAIAASNGGKYLGGVGSSTDPMICEFASPEGASKAAQEAWYLDDIEYAKVLGDSPANIDAGTKSVSESAEGASDHEVEELHSTISNLWDKHTEGDKHPGNDWDKWGSFFPALKSELGDDHAKGLKYVEAASDVGDGPESAGELAATLANAKLHKRGEKAEEAAPVESVEDAIQAVVDGSDVAKVTEALLA